jgi:tRNA(Ile)-lysidine synthetase-like protein
LGAPGGRPLRRILQDRKIPERLRADWPVVVDPQGIVWVPGIGIADRVRLGAKSRAAVQLRYAPESRSRRGVAATGEEP